MPKQSRNRNYKLSPSDHDKIRHLRNEVGLTHKVIAIRMGVSENAIQVVLSKGKP